MLNGNGFANPAIGTLGNMGANGLVGNAWVSALNSGNFGKISIDVSQRIMQFAVKYAF